MKFKNNSNIDSVSYNKTAIKVGFYTALLLALTTVITFGFAITAVPITGPFCQEGCIQYPYLNTLSQYPHDYLWMIPAMVMTVLYVILITALHSLTPDHNKIFSRLAWSFSLMACVLLLTNYFLQFSVIPASLLNQETEGIPLLIQYNPQGIFIVLEEVGYLMMSLSFLCIFPTFSRENRLETAIGWLFFTGFSLTIISLIVIILHYGINRSYRFEVAVITIDFFVLIINGILLNLMFKRRLKAVK